MKMFRNLVCLTLVAAMATGSIADEKKKKGEKKGRKAPSVTQRLVGKLELTDEQKEQAKEIDKKFAEQAKEIAAKRRGILTDEQRKSQQEAQKAAKAAKADGKSPAEIRKTLTAALKLTDEQKKQQQDLNAKQQELNKEILAALKKILTAEQIEKLPKRGGGGRAKKPGAKKPGAKGEKAKKKDKAAE